MKFEISNRFLPTLQQYFQENDILFEVIGENEEEDSTIIETIETIQQERKTEQMTTAYRQKIVKALLFEYQKSNQIQSSKTKQKQKTIDQWLTQYNKNLLEMLKQSNLTPSTLINHDLNKQMLLHRFSQLKSSILRKKADLQKQIDRNQQLSSQFSHKIKDEEEKARLTLQYCELSMKAKQSEQPDDDKEQVARIKGLVKNGLWGLLQQLEEKAEKVKMLKKEVQLLKSEKMIFS